MADCVLLVEDDPRIRQALVLGLGDEGYQVLEAGSGEGALRLVEREQVEVVLLDLMLPGMDGFAVCRSLRARGGLPIGGRGRVVARESPGRAGTRRRTRIVGAVPCRTPGVRRGSIARPAPAT